MSLRVINLADHLQSTNMSGALKAALGKLKTYTLGTPSRITKLANGAGTAGTRAVPTSTHDVDIGVRLDFDVETKAGGKSYKRFKFQVNKGANDKTLKQLVATKKGTDTEFAIVDMPLGTKNPKATVEKLFDDIKKQL